MIVLAFDTCFDACSVALWSSARSRLLAARFEAMDKGHSERIVPMIGEVLVEAGVDLAEVTTLAVTVGPGSFTGVRTGLSVARAIALANGIEIRGTTSLHVMAARIRERRGAIAIAIAVATRDGYIYFQTFEPADGMPGSAACLTTPVQAAAMLGSTPHVIAGSGADSVVTAASGSSVAHELDEAASDVCAAVLARLAVKLPLLIPAKPLYLREPDAKPQPGLAASSPTTRT